MWYYLANGIYPLWATLISGFSNSMSNNHKYFTKKQHNIRRV